jgi:hypothetical protein
MSEGMRLRIEEDRAVDGRAERSDLRSVIDRAERMGSVGGVGEESMSTNGGRAGRDRGAKEATKEFFGTVVD